MTYQTIYQARTHAIERCGLNAARELSQETPITIKRQPGGYGVAVPLKCLSDFHLREVSGGVQKNFGRPVLCARIWCDDIPEADAELFGHSCAHGKGPHEIVVSINKSDNRAAFLRLLASSHC